MGYLEFFGEHYCFHKRIDITSCLLHYFLLAFKAGVGTVHTDESNDMMPGGSLHGVIEMISHG